MTKAEIAEMLELLRSIDKRLRDRGAYADHLMALLSKVFDYSPPFHRPETRAVSLGEVATRLEHIETLLARALKPSEAIEIVEWAEPEK